MGEAPYDQERRNDPLDARIGRIFNEFLDREAQGESISTADLLDEHPEFANELKGYLELVQDLRPGQERIDRLVERGILSQPSDTRYLAALGPYRITGLLGRGGMGIVLKAHEGSLDRTVALKILRPDLIDDATALRRFTREAKAAAALRHPNIVTVYAVGDEGGTSFIAMEYIEGPTLAELIREHGTLPAALICRILQQMLQGLSAAHDAGLIHRDIKPSNILLDRFGSEALDADDADGREPTAFIVKLADFGLARMTSTQTRMTMPGSTPGTPEYMSPEQARGDETIDHRTDLYSAGVVLYEMLTGRTPFRASTPSAVIHQILHDDPCDPRAAQADADPHLGSLAVRLMAKRPEDRLESAEDTVAALDASGFVSSPERRRRLLRRVALAGPVCILLGFAGWFSALSTAQMPLSGVMVEKVNGSNTTTVLARYGDQSAWKVFHRFPDTADCASGAELVNLADGTQVVAAGVIRSLSPDSCLFAFDALKNEAWSRGFSDPRQWPDCGVPTKWGCKVLAVGNIDGVPGDELVIVATDAFEYPTRISVIDPRSGDVRSTFWHTGQLKDVQILPGFFGPHRPAVAAIGFNNKLDGFGLPFPARPYHPQSGEDEPRTSYDIVPVIMILDPLNMDGLGPPRSPLLPDMPVADVYAYAFLDLPASDQGTYFPPGGTERAQPRPDEITCINWIRYQQSREPHGTRSSLLVSIMKARSDCILTVDRHLAPHEVVVSMNKRSDRREKYWRQHWHVITPIGARAAVTGQMPGDG